MKKLALILILLLMPSVVFGAIGDIAAVRVRADGFSFDVDITLFTATDSTTNNMGLGAKNDPTSAKITFTVTSPGYDNTGSLGTIVRTVHGTEIVRKPYSASTSSTYTYDETAGAGVITYRVALEAPIHSSDTATVVMGAGWATDNGTGGTGLPTNACNACVSVTNNSTLIYPKVIGDFAVEQRRAVNGTTAIEVVCNHFYAMNAKPVAAVVITATGATSSHSTSATVTTQILSARGDLLPVYAASLNLSTGGGFTRGELVNINFTCYPWVGDSTAVLDSTTDSQSKTYRIGLLEWTIMDKMIAVVDPGGGNDGTCVASTTQGTADAMPCATQGGAITVCAAQNNSQFSLNRADGCEIQLKAGNYATGKFNAATITNGYLTITHHASTTRAGVIFINAGGSPDQYKYERFYDVTFNRTSNVFLVFGANASAIVMILEHVNFADTQTLAWYSGDTNTDVEFLDCTTINAVLSRGGNDGLSRLNRDTTIPSINNTAGNGLFGDAEMVLRANVTGGFGGSSGWLARVAEINITLAYNKAYGLNGDNFCNDTANNALTGTAVINNLIEMVASAQGICEFSDATITNSVYQSNTFAGQRFNTENDIAAPFVNKSMTNMAKRFNSCDMCSGHREDLFDMDGTIIGNWQWLYQSGSEGNHSEGFVYAGDQDFWGVYSNKPTSPSQAWGGLTPTPQAAGYVLDASKNGTGLGNGDYHPAAMSALLNGVPAGHQPMAFDLDGNARRNDGTGAIGAYESQSTSGNNHGILTGVFH